MNNYTDYDLNEYESLPAKGKEKMVRQISSQTCTGTVNILILILNWWLKWLDSSLDTFRLVVDG